MSSRREIKLLFSPIQINKLELANRVIFAPMHNNLNAPDGSVTQKLIDYFSERADGNPGLMLTPFAAIKRDHPLLGAYSETMIPGLSQLCKAVQTRGSRLFLQIALQGGKAKVDPAAPSAISSKLYMSTPREFRAEEIPSLIQDFVTAAERAQIAGFDGVELHGGHTYLVGQFVSPHTNRREDDYGGSFEKRMRLPESIVHEIRERLGPDFPLGYKLSAHEHLENGVDIKLAVRIAQHMEQAGVDYLHVSSTSSTIYAINNEYIDCKYFSVAPMYCPRNNLSELAAEIKKTVRIPVVAVGGVVSPEDAEAVLRSGSADLVAVGRAFLADPEWSLKAQKGQDIRPCIRCNKCHILAGEGNELRCAVNPRLGREGSIILPAPRSKKIVVVGGGPAGMQAALTASDRGHDVVLYEEGDRVGGNLNLASRPGFKRDLKDFLLYFRKQVEKNDMRVRAGVKASLDILMGENPDKVILATGAHPVTPEIPGIDGEHVLFVDEYFRRYEEFESVKRVVVVGAGLVGSEIALDLSSKCEEVLLIDMLPYEGLLRKEHATNRSVLIKMLESSGVTILGQRKLREVQKDGVVFDSNGTEEFHRADKTILALGFEPRTELRDALAKSNLGFDYYQVGDCIEPRDIFNAVQEGYEVGSKV